ncbi:MAG: hypothetical protein WKG06_13940 [Segetibacter sp.]
MMVMLRGKVAGMDTWVVKLEPDALLPVTLIDFSGEVRGKQNCAALGNGYRTK